MGVNGRRLIGWAAIALAGTVIVAACGGSDESAQTSPAISAVPLGGASTTSDGTADDSNAADASNDVSTSADDSDSSGTSISTTTTLVTNPTNLTVTLPEEEPDRAESRIVAEGSGEIVEPEDTVYLAWEMVNFDTGAVVESTEADLGGPALIPLGFGAIPSALEDAVTGQPVGTRLEVLFPAGLDDLPPQFDRDQAHVLAVEIVSIVDFDEPTPTTQAANEATTSTTNAGPATTARPTTTTPRPTVIDGVFVPAEGPLGATAPTNAAPPDRNTSQVVSRGSGPALQEGDTVTIEYVMVSWSSGVVVKSTEQDLGGPQTIVLGEATVPRNLESAIFRQPVGSRVQVIYAPDLFDLPDGLDRTDAYIVAVDIISKQ